MPSVEGGATAEPRRQGGETTRPARGIRLESAPDDGPGGLVERIQAGDHTAGAYLYRRHRTAVGQYVRRILGEDDADDVAQQVFITVFDHIRRYRDRGLPFERWLFAIARNAALKHREKASRAAVIDPAAIAGEREREAARTAFHSESAVAHFDALTATLSKGQRRVLLLLYGFAMSPSDVASVLEQTPAAVRQTHARALAKLGGRAPRLLGL